MSDRSPARHRAPQRPTTPFDALGDTLTGQLGAVGRSGAVLAVSTGLVATMGMPAGAVTKTAPDSGLQLSRSSVLSASGVALPASVTGGAAITAPASAQVTFEHGGAITTATAAPKAKARQTVRASRSTRSAASTSTAPKASAASDDTGTSARTIDTSSVMSVARSLLGIPYLSGGSTPAGFDCSGFTRYVFDKVGVSLPRTSSQQYAAVRHISRSQAQPGDLVFFLSGGRVYHVGIYAGGNRVIDSPRSGKSTQEREIWSSNIAFGRP